MEKRSTPPKHLSTEAKRWWKKLTAEYTLDDSAGLLLLTTGMEAFDRMRQAQQVIAADGPSVVDRYGRTKAHPLIAVERDARAALHRAMRELNLDLEPLRPGPGRPPGR
jgi:P27 family predicted phage terminase small subunit